MLYPGRTVGALGMRCTSITTVDSARQVQRMVSCKTEVGTFNSLVTHFISIETRSRVLWNQSALVCVPQELLTERHWGYQSYEHNSESEQRVLLLILCQPASATFTHAILSSCKRSAGSTEGLLPHHLLTCDSPEDGMGTS